MKNKKNRSAYFICSLSFKQKNQRVINVVGKVHGTITFKILGKNGFGYDPIFKPNLKKITFGQMNHYKKIRLDHRYQAFVKLKKKLKLSKFVI